MTLTKKQINTVQNIIDTAAREVMNIYQANDLNVELKSDDSPLTKADKASNKIIVKGLKEHFNWPVVTEEDDTSHKLNEATFWLIDPLDGTKEFIKKNGEFTINIALVENGAPVFGAVYAPALNKLYWTDEHGNAMLNNGQFTQTLSVDKSSSEPIAVVSRSHMDSQTEALLRLMKIKKTISKGSSLKFCLVAEGVAHFYPRLAPTMIWDTAAADAVARAAGAKVYEYKTKQALTYSTKQLKNPGFICSSLNLGNNPETQ